VTVDIERWSGGACERTVDDLADEQPVAFKFCGIPHVVMLASPADLDDLAVGFTLSEGIVAARQDIRAVRVESIDGALEVDIDIAPQCFSELLKRRRNLSARTSCGLCGAETVAEAIRPPPGLPPGLLFSAREIHEALDALPAQQPLNARTGSIHAAAFVVPSRGLTLVREDVGRHNALDKLIGALVHRGDELAGGAVVMTSRASYEIVQKAATVGIAAIVAVSAPTAFAVRLARSVGLTLIGFARPGRHVVYAHGERLQP
jgi:FdhD protein